MVLSRWNSKACLHNGLTKSTARLLGMCAVAWPLHSHRWPLSSKHSCGSSLHHCGDNDRSYDAASAVVCVLSSAHHHDAALLSSSQVGSSQCAVRTAVGLATSAVAAVAAGVTSAKARRYRFGMKLFGEHRHARHPRRQPLPPRPRHRPACCPDLCNYFRGHQFRQAVLACALLDSSRSTSLRRGLLSPNLWGLRC